MTWSRALCTLRKVNPHGARCSRAFRRCVPSCAEKHDAQLVQTLLFRDDRYFLTLPPLATTYFSNLVWKTKLICCRIQSAFCFWQRILILSSLSARGAHSSFSQAMQKANAKLKSPFTAVGHSRVPLVHRKMTYRCKDESPVLREGRKLLILKCLNKIKSSKVVFLVFLCVVVLFKSLSSGGYYSLVHNGIYIFPFG